MLSLYRCGSWGPENKSFSRPFSLRWTPASWLLATSSSPYPTTALSTWESEVVLTWGWFCPLRDIWQCLRILWGITSWGREHDSYHWVHRGQECCWVPPPLPFLPIPSPSIEQPHSQEPLAPLPRTPPPPPSGNSARWINYGIVMVEMYSQIDCLQCDSTLIG